MVLLLALAASVTALGTLIGWRMLDHRADRACMDRLIATQPAQPKRFSLAMVGGLPEPARRFFSFAIAPGTPLYTVARIQMQGQFSLGDRHSANSMDMTAAQVLAAPHGFVWKMSGRTGLIGMSGSDSEQWTRFWMMGLVPVARFGGSIDHRRAAFGRYVAEAVFWTPAALLPGPGITWKHIDENTARVIVRHEGLEQPVMLTVNDGGQLTQVAFQRWSDANPEKVYKLQPFGGFLSDYQEFDGFRLPTHVEAGNMFGTAEYFPFFIADVTMIAFPRIDR